MIEAGTRIKAINPSLHAGETGTVIADYGQLLMIKADNEKYERAFKRSGSEGKYFQVDNRRYKIIED